jgi:hypothetical protein
MMILERTRSRKFINPNEVIAAVEAARFEMTVAGRPRASYDECHVPCLMAAWDMTLKNTILKWSDTVDIVSVLARHGHSVVRGSKSRHAVPARAQHD